jgi:hypothetical protein
MKRDGTRDPTSPVSFGAPYADPAITDPTALQYRRSLEERGRYRAPVGGGPTPPIPRLDSDAASGMTMADQAAVARQPAPASGMFVPPLTAAGAPALSRPPANLLPQDLLPEAATQDPAFQAGPGSRYAMAQPALAYKYGVLRNGQHVPPQQLQSGKPGLKPETLKDLQTLQDFQRVREAAESPDARVEAEAAASTAGAAARLGTSRDPADRPASEPDPEQIAKSLEKLDDFDFNTFREMMMRDLLNNDEQRAIVESRVASMDVTDLIMNGFVAQTVPIIPGRFEPEFQSMTGEEDLALKRLLMLESKSVDVNNRYLLDKFSLMSVAVGVRSINRTPLPDHRDKDGKFNEALFLTKFEKVVRCPFHMLSSLGVHYFWFDIRVRKLFVAEKLGNG